MIMSTDPSTYGTITGAAALLADMAIMRQQLTGEDRTSALDAVARGYVAQAADARKRTGIYRYQTTTDEVEEVTFIGALAADALDGTVIRPSTGNVRAYVLAAIERADETPDPFSDADWSDEAAQAEAEEGYETHVLGY